MPNCKVSLKCNSLISTILGGSMNLISVEDFKKEAVELYKESLVPLANLYSYQKLPEYDNLKKMTMENST